MPSMILVATPQPAFGELLRDSLLSLPGCRVVLAATTSEAMALARVEQPVLAILDSAIDAQFAAFFTNLRASIPRLRLIVVPPDNNPAHPALQSIQPDGYLNQPFYLPDLAGLVAKLLFARESETNQAGELAAALPGTLQDRAALTILTEQAIRNTQAVAALVGIYGNNASEGRLHLFRGKLAETTALEVAQLIFRYWNASDKTDLMRFFQSAADQQDYLVYATPLVEHLVLVFIYDPSMPLSVIRPEVRRAAQAFMAQAGPAPVSPSQSATPNAPGGPAQAGPLVQRSAAAEPSTQPLKKTEPVVPGYLSYLSVDIDDETEAEAEPIDLTTLLGSIPAPDAPAVSTRGHDAGPLPETTGDRSERYKQFQTWEIQDPILPQTAEDTHAQPPPRAPGMYVTGENLPSAPHVEPEVDPLEDTRPHVVAALTNLGQLEPVSPALSMLNYTCVLVPRFPQHYLTGELADQLGQWVQQLCLAFGWRLEGISIRPDYLQWSVQVAPSISPGNLVRIVRQRTSLNIHQKFTHLAAQNPSGDFWATGYLIVSGAQPPSAQLLRDYITQTRKRQGVIR